MSATATQPERLNGVNMPRLYELVEEVKRDPKNGLTRWNASTRWTGGATSEARISGCEIGGKRCPKDFHIKIDEPFELAGTNTQPNPQEYLLSALNACMMVGYVALASLHGIELDYVEIDSHGEIDLRGFLGLDPSVPAGYDAIHYTVRIKGDGTPEQFEEIHRTVIATSPNRFNLASPIPLKADLVVE